MEVVIIMIVIVHFAIIRQTAEALTISLIRVIEITEVIKDAEDKYSNVILRQGGIDKEQEKGLNAYLSWRKCCSRFTLVLDV